MAVLGNFEKPDLGYKFYPAKNSKSPGYPQVDIYIHESPTGHHFDPEKLSVNVVQPNQKFETLVVRHPFSSLVESPVFRVCAGILTLQDIKGKKIELFSFGGVLQIGSHGAYTLCSVSSPVPILNMGGLSPSQKRLADEIICILAERRAANLQSSGAFEEKLTTISPEILYSAFLMELSTRLQQLPSSGSGMVSEMKNLVRREIESLKKQGIWPPGKIPAIKNIL